MSDKTPVEIIQAIVAAEYGVTLELMLSRDRREQPSTARQHAVALCYRVLPLTFEAIADAFSYESTSSAIHARDSIADRIDTDQEMFERHQRLLVLCVTALQDRVQNGPAPTPDSFRSRMLVLESLENTKAAFADITQRPERASVRIDKAIVLLVEARSQLQAELAAR